MMKKKSTYNTFNQLIYRSRQSQFIQKLKSAWCSEKLTNSLTEEKIWHTQQKKINFLEFMTGLFIIASLYKIQRKKILIIAIQNIELKPSLFSNIVKLLMLLIDCLKSQRLHATKGFKLGKNTLLFNRVDQLQKQISAQKFPSLIQCFETGQGHIIKNLLYPTYKCVKILNYRSNLLNKCVLKQILCDSINQRLKKHLVCGVDKEDYVHGVVLTKSQQENIKQNCSSCLKQLLDKEEEVDLKVKFIPLYDLEHHQPTESFIAVFTFSAKKINSYKSFKGHRNFEVIYPFTYSIKVKSGDFETMMFSLNNALLKKGSLFQLIEPFREEDQAYRVLILNTQEEIQEILRIKRQMRLYFDLQAVSYTLEVIRKPSPEEGMAFNAAWKEKYEEANKSMIQNSAGSHYEEKIMDKILMFFYFAERNSELPSTTFCHK